MDIQDFATVGGGWLRGPAPSPWVSSLSHFALGKSREWVQLLVGNGPMAHALGGRRSWERRHWRWSQAAHYRLSLREIRGGGGV
jgi:hypothetical protein